MAARKNLVEGLGVRLRWTEVEFDNPGLINDL